MPRIARPPTPSTDDWQQLQLQLQWPEQVAYEIIRPVVLFGRPAAHRAQETGQPRRTISHKAARFDAQGMLSLFAAEPVPKADDWRRLPLDMQQAIVDLSAQYSDFRPNEIASICYAQFGRRPSPHTVQRVLAEGPPPSRTSRRFPRYPEISDPAGRRFAVLRLHAEGWNIKSIAAYMDTTRPTIYATLRRWVADKVLDDKSHAPKHRVRKVDLKAMNAVRELQENPELGEWRIHAALKQIGIHLSPRTCGRILALNRKLYGSKKEAAASHEAKPDGDQPGWGAAAA